MWANRQYLVAYCKMLSTLAFYAGLVSTMCELAIQVINNAGHSETLKNSFRLKQLAFLRVDRLAWDESRHWVSLRREGGIGSPLAWMQWKELLV